MVSFVSMDDGQSCDVALTLITDCPGNLLCSHFTEVILEQVIGGKKDEI